MCERSKSDLWTLHGCKTCIWTTLRNWWLLSITNQSPCNPNIFKEALPNDLVWFSLIPPGVIGGQVFSQSRHIVQFLEKLVKGAGIISLSKIPRHTIHALNTCTARDFCRSFGLCSISGVLRKRGRSSNTHVSNIQFFIKKCNLDFSQTNKGKNTPSPSTNLVRILT